MNTSFWGPDGWKLLHCVARNCPDTMSKNYKQKLQRFFGVVEKILPCVYCRNSLNKFYKELPLSNYLTSGKCVRSWFYLIHNKVNNKLRKQGEPIASNPKAKQVFAYYDGYCQNCQQCGEIPGWDFIYCVCMNYTPGKNLYYRRFFSYLSQMLPFPAAKKYFAKYIKENPFQKSFSTPRQAMRWFYTFDKEFRGHNVSFQDTWGKYLAQKAGCKDGTCKL
jgi:hypothetical protein